VTSKNGAHRLQKNKRRPFFEVTPKNDWQKLHDNFLDKFGKIWVKILCTHKKLRAPEPMTVATFFQRAVQLKVCKLEKLIFQKEFHKYRYL